MKVGFDAADGDYILGVDSDTIIWDTSAVRTLLGTFGTDERIGAVTGEVSVENNHHNLLTRLIGLRYWMAFNQERAPQSLFGVVSCCSGPFSMYKAEVIRRVEDDFVSQRFLGKPCTFGDDRHLTNLVLAAGYDVRYNSFAVADTFVPTTIKSYLKQQLRWSKSFYRELLWTSKFMFRRNAYLSIDLLLQAVLPLMLMVTITATVVRLVDGDFEAGLRYALVVALIGLLRSAYGLYRTRDKGFIYFAAYGFFHVGLLIPVRLWAILTIRRTGWGTRGRNFQGEVTD